jgi:hypothetical protein
MKTFLAALVALVMLSSLAHEEPNSLSTGLVPHFLVNPPMDRIIEAIEAEIQRLQASRTLLAGDTNSAQSRQARDEEKSATTGCYRASGRMPRGSTHVI